MIGPMAIYKEKGGGNEDENYRGLPLSVIFYKELNGSLKSAADRYSNLVKFSLTLH